MVLGEYPCPEDEPLRDTRETRAFNDKTRWVWQKRYVEHVIKGTNLWKYCQGGDDPEVFNFH